MTGVKGRSGRRKSLTTLINEALANVDERLPELFEGLIHRALEQIEIICPQCKHEFNIPGGGDRESTFYLIDRRLGKSKTSAEIALKGGEQIGVETLKALIEGMARRKIELESKPEELEAVRLKYLKEGEE